MSIGVIGGADGPTQIFVTSGISSYTIAAIAIVCIVTVATIIWMIRKGNNKN